MEFRARIERSAWVGMAIGAMVASGCLVGGGASFERLLQQPISARAHSQIAREYRQRAAEARRLAAVHEVMAARYRDGVGGNGPAGEQMAEHCRALERDYADAAARYDALAANHASLAAPWRDAPGRKEPEDRGPWR